jgi:hypothetical protein
MLLFLSIMAVLAWYSVACLAAGMILLRLFSGRASAADDASPGVVFATAFLLGQGVLASLWLLLALAGWFTLAAVLGVLLIVVLAGGWPALPRLRRLAHHIRSIWRELRADTWGWQALAGMAMFLCLVWVTSLGRSLQGDASAFYMALAKVTAATHRLVPLPGYEDFSNIGLQGELHYAALLMLSGRDAAQLFAWPTIVAGSAMLVGLSAQAGLGRRGQWLVFSMVFSSSAVVWLSGDGKVDLFAAGLGLAAYYWAVQVRGRLRPMALWLTGLFGGLAIVAKFSYLPVLLPGLAFLVVWGYADGFRGRDWLRSGLQPLSAGVLRIGVACLLAALPHLVKNGLLFGNPISPFGAGRSNWTDQSWFDAATTRQIVLTYPLALTLGNYGGQYGDLSPLLLAFAPLALLLPRPRSLLASPLAAVTVAGVLGVLAWVILRPSVLSPRYMLATLLLFCLLPARAAEHITLHESRPRWLTVAVMASTHLTLLAVGSYFLNMVFWPVVTYQYLAGKLPECARDGPWCRAMQAVNQAAEPGERVFLASYHRYWLRPDLLQCVSQAVDKSLVGETPEARWQNLYQRGFHYLLADQTSFAAAIEQLNLTSPPPWVRLMVIFDESPLTVYRLDFVGAAGSLQATCQRLGTGPVWEVAAP